MSGSSDSSDSELPLPNTTLLSSLTELSEKLDSGLKKLRNVKIRFAACSPFTYDTRVDYSIINHLFSMILYENDKVQFYEDGMIVQLEALLGALFSLLFCKYPVLSPNFVFRDHV